MKWEDWARTASTSNEENKKQQTFLIPFKIKAKRLRPLAACPAAGLFFYILTNQRLPYDLPPALLVLGVGQAVAHNVDLFTVGGAHIVFLLIYTDRKSTRLNSSHRCI